MGKDTRPRDENALERRVARLSAAVVGLTLLWLGTVAWAALSGPAASEVLSVERLEIREPDGELAFVLAGSGHPTAATLDGEVLLADQTEERRHPQFIYFDGRGDEVGGLMLRTVDGPEGTSVARYFAFDGHDHQEAITLGHSEGPDGSVTRLRVIDHRPGTTLVGALETLGLEPGITRAELDEAMASAPPERLERFNREIVGSTRAVLGSNIDDDASLTLHDAEGRPRVVIEAPAEGEPSLRFLDEAGEAVLRLPN
ncbi:MAG: hypothetical protein ACOC8B_06580 [Gemmatimonadota bacterium]